MSPAPIGDVLRAIATGQRIVVIEEDTADASGCVLCPVGTFNSNTASTDVSACQPCASGATTASNGAALASACVCGMGYSGYGIACTGA